MSQVKSEKVIDKEKGRPISAELGSVRPRNQAMAIAFEACRRERKKKAKR